MNAAARTATVPTTLDRDAIATAVDIAHPAAPPDVRCDLIEAEVDRLLAQGGAA